MRSATLLIALPLLLAAPGARPSAAPSPLADGRFSVSFTVPGDRPITPVVLISEVHARAGIGLVACGPALLRPMERRERTLTAREAMSELAEHIGGMWRPVGKGGSVFTLGPPAGFERIAQLSPAQLRGHMDGEWRALLRQLRATDRKHLQEGRAIRGADLPSGARESAREIVRALWWRQRHSPACALRASAAERDAYELKPFPEGMCLVVERSAPTILGNADRFPPRYEEARRNPE
jgi:hypothetical protein